MVGITSAVACKIALDLFKDKNECRVIMIDTGNEDEDTYRFKKDCEKWFGQPIEVNYRNRERIMKAYKMYGLNTNH